jgi:hypothetical protein
MSELTIGDTNRDGTLCIVDTAWDSNGTLRVTVEDKIGTGLREGGLDVRAMRRLARRALMYPEKTRSARLIRTTDTHYGTTLATFAVSRNER